MKIDSVSAWMAKDIREYPMPYRICNESVFSIVNFEPGVCDTALLKKVSDKMMKVKETNSAFYVVHLVYSMLIYILPMYSLAKELNRDIMSGYCMAVTNMRGPRKPLHILGK